MGKQPIRFIILSTAIHVFSSCSASLSLVTEPNISTSQCTLKNYTTETSISFLGCSKLSRDTTSCLGVRQAQGLNGFWLRFSCRVTLIKSGSDVIITTDGQPDYKSPYFAMTNPCYESDFPAGRNAVSDKLGIQSISVTVPFAPAAPVGSVGTTMNTGVVGIAINGVAIFSNAPAPGDNIYAKVTTLDKCEGRPDGTKYNYHIEPPTVSNSDSNFVGVLRDGFPVYGRFEPDRASIPTLNKASGGGHLGITTDSPITSVYHYHVHLQTSGADGAYFITSGFYMNTPGVCSGCL